jgi:hypothetical protein
MKKTIKEKVYCVDCKYGHENFEGAIKVFRDTDTCCNLIETNNYSGAIKILKKIIVTSNAKGTCPHFTKWELKHVKCPSAELIKKFTKSEKTNNTKKWWQFWKEDGYKSLMETLIDAIKE